MKKSVIIFLLTFSALNASIQVIDERNIDIFFANGIDTSKKEAKKNIDILDTAILDEMPAVYEKYLGQVGTSSKVGYAYNKTNGKVLDIWESIAQKLNFQDLIDAIFATDHENDIEEQVTQYRSSIENGHRVLVVAHSQGNLFTAEALNKLDDWMQEYFYAVSVASPRAFKIKSDTPHIAFYNDIVPWLGGVYVPLDNPNGEAGSIESHAFTYYMGSPSKDSGVTTNVAKDKIMSAVGGGILNLAELPSQWQIKSETKTINVCGERRAELVHFKGAVTLAEEVFPFYTDTVTVDEAERYTGKVYLVPDSNGTDRYVLASSEGTQIVDVEGRGVILDDSGNDVGCYQLDGTGDEIKKSCGDAGMTDGILEVTLGWKSPDINLRLSVIKDDGEVGNLDDIVGCQKRHWYIVNESDVKPGTYVVHVTTQDISTIDESILPEVVVLNVKVPDGGINISLPIPTTDLLNMGAVANIYVKYKENGGIGVSVETSDKVEEKIYYTATRYKTNESGETYNYEVVSLWNQVALGPIANAQTEIISLSESDFGQVVYAGYTSSGDTLETNGLMLLPSTLKALVSNVDLYLISATGGEDVDANDDLNLDATPISNFGTVHAIVSGSTIKENGLKVNILTEMGYQVSKELLFNTEDALTVPAKLDEVALALLNKDMNNDGTIDHADLHAWVPSFDKDALRFNYDRYIYPIVLKIYNADDIYADVQSLIYPNTRPVAVAGEDVMINFGESVTLDGSGSYDSDGQIVEYLWRKGGLTYCHGVTPECTVEGLTAGRHLYELIVKDDSDTVDIDSIEVTVKSEAKGISVFDTPGYAMDVTLSPDGTVAYVADYYKGGLQIIDISNPLTPSLKGSYISGNYTESVTLSEDGTRAYVANGYGGFLILDISDVSAPFLLGKYYTSDYATDVRVSSDGTIAYVTAGYKGLQVIDISDPSLPSLIASCDTTDVAWGVTLSADGTIGYVADGGSGLQIIDISNPETPYLIGSFDTPGFAQKVILSMDGTVAYVSDGSGLRIIDISDTKSPFLIGNYVASSFVQNVALSANGSLAFVADWRSGLQIIDITNPATVSLIGGYDTSGSATAVTTSADGTIAYIADRESGLQIIDISAFVR